MSFLLEGEGGAGCREGCGGGGGGWGEDCVSVQVMVGLCFMLHPFFNVQFHSYADMPVSVTREYLNMGKFLLRMFLSTKLFGCFLYMYVL